MDGDGLPDLALRMPRFSWASNPLEKQGAVFVLSGRAASAMTLEDVSIAALYGPPYSYYRVGISVDGGDFDGDGQADLLIGTEYGDAQLRYGPLEGTIGDLYGDGIDEAFGLYRDEDQAARAVFLGTTGGWLFYGGAL